MTNTMNTFFFLAFVCTMVHANWIVEKNVQGVIDADDDYWYVKIANQKVSRPAFPAYIRFYNKHTAKSEYAIDCSKSALILYYNAPPQIIFRTTGHLWSEGDSYYITLDEGVLYSNNIENSTAYLNPAFWQFNVIRPFIV